MESKMRTRREFLQGTAVAVGAAVLTACAPAAQTADAPASAFRGAMFFSSLCSAP